MAEREKGGKEGKSEWGRGKSKNSFASTLPSSLLPLPYKLSRSPFLILLLLVLLSACEEDVTAPRTDWPFSLYGVLSPKLDTQQVRVFPIEPLLQPAPPEPLDAVFTSTDLATGEVRVWRDSLVEEAGGQVTHVFWAPFRAAYGHPYRLEAQRTDGAATYVEVAVPPAVEVVPQEVEITSSTRVMLPVLLAGASHLLNVEVKYEVQYAPGDTPVVMSYVLPYNLEPEPVAGGRRIMLNLHAIYLQLKTELSEDRLWRQNYGVRLHGMTLRLVVASADWDPPGGSFDPEILAQPDVLWNVENGYGFVAAGYPLERTWLPPGEALAAAGFRVE